jgi:hypothetical protein
MAISETSLKDVALMAIEEINGKGGLLGKKLEPVVVDPASDWPLFAEKARDNLDGFYDTINLVLDATPAETLRRNGPQRKELAARLSVISTAYLHEQFTKRRQQMLAEQVFLMEALRDDRLAGLARSYREAWTAGLRQILKRLDSPSPRITSRRSR